MSGMRAWYKGAQSWPNILEVSRDRPLLSSGARHQRGISQSNPVTLQLRRCAADSEASSRPNLNPVISISRSERLHALRAGGSCVGGPDSFFLRGERGHQGDQAFAVPKNRKQHAVGRFFFWRVGFHGGAWWKVTFDRPRSSNTRESTSDGPVDRASAPKEPSVSFRDIDRDSGWSPKRSRLVTRRRRVWCHKFVYLCSCKLRCRHTGVGQMAFELTIRRFFSGNQHAVAMA